MLRCRVADMSWVFSRQCQLKGADATLMIMLEIIGGMNRLPSVCWSNWRLTLIWRRRVCIKIRKGKKLIRCHVTTMHLCWSLACLPEDETGFRWLTKRIFFLRLAAFAICFSSNTTDWSVLAIKLSPRTKTSVLIFYSTFLLLLHITLEPVKLKGGLRQFDFLINSVQS